MIERGLIKSELIEHMGSDLSVVNAARVSFNKVSTDLVPKDKGLLNFLAKHQHWSPFAHPQLSFRYTVPIFVARQEFKHIVGLVRNEISRRYVADSPVFFLPDEWRGAPTDGAKQGSSDEIIDHVEWIIKDPEDELGGGEELTMSVPIDTFVEQGFEDALFRYETLVVNNVAPEQARMVLPQAMFTSYIVTGSLYAFANFVKLRTDPHAQKEIRDLAQLTAAQIEPLFPESWKVLMNV